MIGCVLALVTLYDIVALSDSFGDVRLSVPYVSLAVLLVGTVAASLSRRFGRRSRPAASGLRSRCG